MICSDRPRPESGGFAPADCDYPRLALPHAWVERALCRAEHPDQMFVRGAAQREAAAACRRCPVIVQCGAEALDNRVEFGVWGGMTERQRRALLKRHPNVESWAELMRSTEPVRATAG
ncbi:WhiB family redox-sensing transcriptional regulator [Rhodococcus sp. PvR044]|nr:WhiB family redox-sensing transcriptional regulator [Rhodococcus sp. PvR099]PTR41246.1 transcription factor WhiB [Rhodococcus sp. OK611]SNX92068.1 transcription factor WhiB [Rhodococcus sp. OK270]